MKKQHILKTLKRNNITSLTNIRFIIARQKLQIKINGKLLNMVLERDLSWQEKVAWYNRTKSYTGTKTDSLEYSTIFLNSKELAQAAFKLKCDRRKGKLNPAYQHGGKFSSGSKNFIKYVGLSDAEKEAKIAVVHNKISKSNRENGNNDTTLAYWLKETDGDIEKANELLSNRQTTFSLSICEDKYGSEEGYIIWKRRQDKWQKTLNAKSDAEILEINKKKATKINYRSLWGNELDSDGLFYILELKSASEKFYKIGITSRTIQKRYTTGIDGYTYTILYQMKGTINECFKMEQSIISANKEISYVPNIKFGGYTECFSSIPSELSTLI